MYILFLPYGDLGPLQPAVQERARCPSLPSHLIPLLAFAPITVHAMVLCTPWSCGCWCPRGRSSHAGLRKACFEERGFEAVHTTEHTCMLHGSIPIPRLIPSCDYIKHNGPKFREKTALD